MCNDTMCIGSKSAINKFIVVLVAGNQTQVVMYCNKYVFGNSVMERTTFLATSALQWVLMNSSYSNKMSCVMARLNLPFISKRYSQWYWDLLDMDTSRTLVSITTSGCLMAFIQPYVHIAIGKPLFIPDFVGCQGSFLGVEFRKQCFEFVQFTVGQIGSTAFLNSICTLVSGYFKASMISFNVYP